MLGLFSSSDAAVVHQVLSGKRERFGVLVERHVGTVYAVAYSHSRNHEDAEDITQEAFLKAFASLDGLREPRKFGGWISVIARNAAQTFAKKRNRESAVTASAATGQTETPDPSRGELRAVLREALDKLDQSTREILMLQYFAGKNAREIANTLGITHVAARKRLQRAREALSRDLLGEFEQAVKPRRTLSDQTKTIMQAVLAAGAAWELAGTAGASVLAAWGVSKLGLAALSVGAVAVVAGGVWLVSQLDEGDAGVAPEEPPPVVAANPQELEPEAPEVVEEETPVPEPEAVPAATEESSNIRYTWSEQPDPDLQKMLARRVTMVFEDIEVSSVMEFLQNTYRVPFLIDDRVVTVPEYVLLGGDEEELLEPDNTAYATDGMVELANFEEVPIEEILDETCAALGLAYWPEPAYIWISTADRIRNEMSPHSKADYEKYANAQILETLATLEFEDIHMNDIVEFLSSTYNLNVVVDQRVVAPEPESEPESRRLRIKALATPGDPASNGVIEYISLKSATLSDALTALARLLDLAYVVLGSDVVISSPSLIALGAFPEDHLITVEAFHERINAKKRPLAEKLQRILPQPVESPGADTSGTRSGRRGPTPSVRLTDIQEPTPGQYRAQLKFSGGTSNWYSIGAKFEDYELVEIDPESRCVKIHWSVTSTVYRLCVG